MKTREPDSLWVLPVTPSRASFSSLEFQEMVYGRKHTVGSCWVTMAWTEPWRRRHLCFCWVQSAGCRRRRGPGAHSTDRSAHRVHLICRFPLKREESGSLIKGAWLKRPVIRGARNLNLKRSVQLHFETIGRHREAQAVGKIVAEPDLGDLACGRIFLLICILCIFLFCFLIERFDDEVCIDRLV